MALCVFDADTEYYVHCGYKNKLLPDNVRWNTELGRIPAGIRHLGSSGVLEEFWTPIIF
jgi:hypothetical protein